MKCLISNEMNKNKIHEFQMVRAAVERKNITENAN